MSQHSILVLVALAALSTPALGTNKLSCYSCTSETSQGCGDPIDKNLVKPEMCTSDLANSVVGSLNTGLKGLSNFFGLEKTPQINANFVCLKGSYVLTNDDGSEKKIVLRSCAPEGGKLCDTLNEKAKEGNNKMKNVFCEECTGEGCNGVAGLSPTTLLFILASAVPLLLFR